MTKKTEQDNPPLQKAKPIVTPESFRGFGTEGFDTIPKDSPHNLPNSPASEEQTQ